MSHLWCSLFCQQFEVVTPTAEKEDADKASFHSPVEGSPPEGGFKDAEERAVFENHLTQLHEQLVATMIENQSLRKHFWWFSAICMWVFKAYLAGVYSFH